MRYVPSTARCGQSPCNSAITARLIAPRTASMRMARAARILVIIVSEAMMPARHAARLISSSALVGDVVEDGVVVVVGAVGGRASSTTLSVTSVIGRRERGAVLGDC